MESIQEGRGYGVNTGSRSGCIYSLINPVSPGLINPLFLSSPLHIAAKSGLVKVVKELVNRGADLNAIGILYLLMLDPLPNSSLIT